MTAEACRTATTEVTHHVNRRLLIAVFAISNTSAYVAMIQILPVILDPIADDLGVTRTAVAAASTASTLMGALAALPVGRLLDRHGGRAVMASGSAIGAAAVLLCSLVTSVSQMYVCFAAIGLSIAMSTYEAAFAVIVVAAEAEHRDRTILTVTMIAGLGTYLVYPVLGWLNTEFGWRTALVILGAVFAVTAVPGHMLAIPSRRVHLSRVQHRVGVPIGAALRQRRFWLVLVAFVAQAASVSAFLLLIVSYLVDVGHPMAVATAMPIAVGVLQILSRLALTTAGRRFRLAPITAVAFAVQGAGLLLLPTVGLSIPLTLLCVAAVGLGQGVGVIARPSIVADHFGVVHFASVLAAITVPMALARAGAPLFAAWLGDWRFLVIGGTVALIGSVALIPLSTVRV